MKKHWFTLLTLSLLTACSGSSLPNSNYSKENGNDNFNAEGNLVLPDFAIDGVIDVNDYQTPSLIVEMGGFEGFETKIKGMVVFGERGLTVGFISQDKYLSSSTDYNDPQFVVNSDNVEFYIDVLNDKGKTAKEDDFAFLVNPEEYIEMRNGTGSYWSSWSGVVDYAVKVDGTINDDSDIDVGWTCEIFLPYQTFGFNQDSVIAVAFGSRDKNTFEQFSKWTGCGPDPQNINTYISMDKNGAIAQKVNDLTVNNGSFEYEDDAYVSNNNDSLGTFEERTIQEGTLSVDVYLPLGTEKFDNGITLQVNSRTKVFWENEGTSYYFFFISRDGDAVLGQTDNGEWIAHQIYQDVSFKKGEWNNFKVVFSDNYMACYLNGNFLFANFAYLENLSFGLRSGCPKVKYANITVSESTEGGYVGIDGYHISAGNFEYATEDHKQVKVSEITGDGAILTSNDTLSSGTLETTVTMSTPNDCGIIFKLNDNRKASYWEDGTSYYFFFINRDGLAFLGRVNNGWKTLATLPIEGFDVNQSYTLKVQFEGDKIQCYLNDTLYFDYTDKEHLPGQGYGLRAGSVGTTFTLFGGE